MIAKKEFSIYHKELSFGVEEYLLIPILYVRIEKLKIKKLPSIFLIALRLMKSKSSFYQLQRENRKQKKTQLINRYLDFKEKFIGKVI
jgi:hypothetical protein